MKITSYVKSKDGQEAHADSHLGLDGFDIKGKFCQLEFSLDERVVNLTLDRDETAKLIDDCKSFLQLTAHKYSTKG